MDQISTPTLWISFMPILTVVVTAAATLFGVFLSNRNAQNTLRLQLDHQRRQAESEKNASRLEELFVAIGHFAHSTSMFYVPFLSAASGQVTLKWAREKSLQEGFKNAPDHERLEMMFYLYYPQLKSDFALFKAVLQDVHSKWSPCEKALENRQTPTDEQKKAFATAFLLIDLRAKDLKERVAKLADTA